MGGRDCSHGISPRGMFGLIGHSTSFEAARRKALELGFDHIADGDLDVWCSAPPQLVEHVEVTSPVGTRIKGAYICLLYTSPRPRDS